MSDASYGEPLNKLTELGRPDTYKAKDWTDYVSEYNLSDEHVSDLIKMLEEHTQPIEDFDADTPASWTAIHVWRALGQLKSEAAVQPMIDAMMRDTWEDWGWEDFPQAIALFGEPAIEALTAELSQRADDYNKHPILLNSTLEMIGNQHEDLRDRIADILISQLEKAETNDAALNGFMIITLAEWNVKKALPVIEKSFAGDYVDISIGGDWEEVQVDFGLKTLDEIDVAAKNAKRRANMLRQMSANTIDLDDLPKPSPKRPSTGKTKKKKKRKQAQMQRKQNPKKKKK